jgi:phage repressor protein C with HTH and peptisase S24 domain
VANSDEDDPTTVRRTGGDGVHRRRLLFTALVREPSMVPTLRDGDAILVHGTGRIRPGDVVVVEFANMDGLFVKRAVREVPGGWWVEGDNAVMSADSRRYGPARVVGRVLLRWWPRLALVRGHRRRGRRPAGHHGPGD